MPGQIHLRTLVNQDGAAILDTKLGTITTLNVAGAHVWQALQRGELPSAIAAQLAQDAGEPVDQVARDIDEFIETLKRQGLLAAGREDMA